MSYVNTNINSIMGDFAAQFLLSTSLHCCCCVRIYRLNIPAMKIVNPNSALTSKSFRPTWYPS